MLQLAVRKLEAFDYFNGIHKWRKTATGATTTTTTGLDHTYPANSTAEPDILNPLSRVGKIFNESDNVRTGESECFRIRWQSKFVSSLLPNNKPIWRRNSNNKANMPPLSHALWRMLWTHFIAEEPWVPQWIRIPSKCMWTGEFNLNTLRVDGEIFESGKQSCGFKTIRIARWVCF